MIGQAVQSLLSYFSISFLISALRQKLKQEALEELTCGYEDQRGQREETNLDSMKKERDELKVQVEKVGQVIAVVACLSTIHSSKALPTIDNVHTAMARLVSIIILQIKINNGDG